RSASTRHRTSALTRSVHAGRAAGAARVLARVDAAARDAALAIAASERLASRRHAQPGARIANQARSTAGAVASLDARAAAAHAAGVAADPGARIDTHARRALLARGTHHTVARRDALALAAGRARVAAHAAAGELHAAPLIAGLERTAAELLAAARARA